MTEGERIDLRGELQHRSCPARICVDNKGYYILVSFGARGLKRLYLPDSLENVILETIFDETKRGFWLGASQ
jgi:hypothetical protein